MGKGVHRFRRTSAQSQVKETGTLLTAKDCFTRWVEAFPMQSITTEETTRLLETELFSRWGIPQQIHSDQGAQFTSPVFVKWCEELGIKKTVTPSYNPKSNQVERSHKDIKAIITALLDNNAGKDWQDMLHIALLALRTARNRHTGVTPFYANFGKEARMAVDLIYETPDEAQDLHDLHGQKFEKLMQKCYRYMRENMNVAVERARQDYRDKLPGKPLKENDLVWLYTPIVNRTIGKKFSIYWTGPWMIIQEICDVMFRIKTMGDWNKRRIEAAVSIDRLKHYKENPDREQPQLDLTLEDISMEDEFVEQAVEDPDQLPQFNLSTRLAQVADGDDDSFLPGEELIGRFFPPNRALPPSLGGGGGGPGPPPPPPAPGAGPAPPTQPDEGFFDPDTPALDPRDERRGGGK